MNTPLKLITCGSSALFLTALTLHAQAAGAASSAGSASSSSAASSQTMPTSSPQSSSQMGSSTGQYGSSSSAQGTTPSAASTFGMPSSNPAPYSSPSQSFNANGSSAGSTAGSYSGSMNTSPTSSNSPSFYSGSQSGTQQQPQFGTDPNAQQYGMQANTPANTQPQYGVQGTTQPQDAMQANPQYGTQANTQQQYGTQYNTQQQYGTQANAQYGSQGQYNTPTVASGGGFVASDASVTTFVQQLDTQGPAVVQRVSTQVGDLACSQDTVQNLVDALHSGRSVTISANGQSSTFDASGAHMGYGEAYIALAVASQELRNAGVTSCATPEQWHAVLLGGPLQVTNTSMTVNSSSAVSDAQQMPGIVTLRTQGQGWGQIAQSANVQLGQIVSGSDVAGAPTGFSSAEMNQGHADVNAQNKGDKKHHWWNGKDKSEKKDANSSPFTPSTPSTHADNSAQPDNR